jgi:hypothetical protein
MKAPRRSEATPACFKKDVNPVAFLNELVDLLVALFFNQTFTKTKRALVPRRQLKHTHHPTALTDVQTDVQATFLFRREVDGTFPKHELHEVSSWFELLFFCTQSLTGGQRSAVP